MESITISLRYALPYASTEPVIARAVTLNKEDQARRGRPVIISHFEPTGYQTGSGRDSEAV
jgi:hypothetical protein